MKRGLWLSLGVVLLLLGLALTVLGTVVALAIGSDDTISSASSRVRSAGVAVVADNLVVDGGAVPLPEGLGTLTFVVTGRDGRPVFVGAGASSDVRAYLKGAPYSQVLDLSAGAPATTRTVPGSTQPGAPATQTFWSDSGSGTTASMTARLSPDTALVIMNDDASRVVDADLAVTLHVSHSFAYAWAVAAAGAVLVVLALLCLWRARVARRRRQAAAGAGEQADLVPELAATVLPGVGAVPVAAASDGETVDAAAADVELPSVEVAAAPAEVGDGPAADVPGEPDASSLEEDLVDEPVAAAAPSPALAALVAAASGDVTEDATVEIPVVAEAPVETDAPDPVFDELVSAYGVDPVHDPLVPPASAGPVPATERATDGDAAAD